MPVDWGVVRRWQSGVKDGGRRPKVTVQICGDLGTIRPLVEGQPSTEFPLQTVSVPSNVNSYARKDGLTRSLFEVNDQTDVQDSGAKLKGDTLPDSLGALEDAEYSASIANRTAN